MSEGQGKVTKWFLYGNIGSGGLLNVGYKDKSKERLAGKEYPTIEVATFKRQEDARFVLEANEVLHETGMGPRELQQQNQQLRRLLASAYSGINLYGDDGELSDGSERPHIDYVRMTPTEIEAAFHERAKRKLELARNETE